MSLPPIRLLIIDDSAYNRRNIADVFAKGHHCVLLENHGVVIGGATLAEAFQRFETLEFTAKTIIKARMLGQVRYLTDAEIAIARDAEPEWTTFPHHQPSTQEKELRARLADFVRRAYRQRLFISTQGSFSARVDAESFLITPYRQDRGTIDVHDLVLVRNGDCEAAGVPSRAARIPADRSLILRARGRRTNDPDRSNCFELTRVNCGCLSGTWCGETHGYRHKHQCGNEYGLHVTPFPWLFASRNSYRVTELRRDPTSFEVWMPPRVSTLYWSRHYLLDAQGSGKVAHEIQEHLGPKTAAVT
jgi:ribulose-5-phosphate 4-epimerase/fuculose-1-phosphate aldolase